MRKTRAMLHGWHAVWTVRRASPQDGRLRDKKKSLWFIHLWVAAAYIQHMRERWKEADLKCKIGQWKTSVELSMPAQAYYHTKRAQQVSVPAEQRRCLHNRF